MSRAFTRLPWARVMHVVLLVTFLAFSCDRVFASPVGVCQELTVAIRDPHGVLPRDLGPGNFRGALHGHPISIISTESGIKPGRLVMLLDVSTSMTDTDWEFEFSRAAAMDAALNTHSSVPIALFTFADKISLKVSLGTSRMASINFLKREYRKDDSAVGGGRTALFDAVTAAVHLLSPSQMGDSIYLITDGGDNRSHASVGDAKNALLKNHIRMFALILSRGQPTTMEEISGASDVRQLAVESGGSALFIASPSSTDIRYIDPASPTFRDHQLQSAARQMYEELDNFYVLKVGQFAAEKPEKWKLQVLDDRGEVLKGLELHYPELLPCDPTPSSH